MREKNYAVLGLGRYGMKVADTVALTGATVLVADSDIEKIDSVADPSLRPFHLICQKPMLWRTSVWRT